MKHSTGVQRAEIHTEDLDISIGRTLEKAQLVTAQLNSKTGEQIHNSKIGLQKVGINPKQRWDN